MTLLPPHFILSLSFRPNNNTALKLISAMQPSPLNQPSDLGLDGSEPDNLDLTQTGQENVTFNEFASLLLSTAATYLHGDRYFPIWENVSSAARHSLMFIVTNGTISSCLDGDFRPSNPGVVLWEEGSGRQLTMRFSKYLHSMRSLVSVCVCVCVHV